MRELYEVTWETFPTPEQLLLHGLAEIAQHAPGGHADPNNPCYGEKREYKDFAGRILESYRKAKAAVHSQPKDEA